jgi:formate C-acetyltransferase
VISQRVARDVAPKPLMSIMYEGCMESGKDVSAGGAMYNYGPGVVWTGLATYADSMAAIKKLVFDDRKYTLTQLCEGLKADFVGYEQMHQDCLNAPKYGNDDDYADNIAADIIDYTEHIHLNFKTLYSHMSTGTLSISNNTPFGEMTGASANGRKAWTPLSDGISPSQGADHRGPTAIIKSVSKLSNDAMNIGMVHNFKLMSGLLDTPRARTASSRCCERIFLVDNATGEGIPELRAYLEEDVPTISLEEAKRRQRLGLRDWEPLPAGA